MAGNTYSVAHPVIVIDPTKNNTTAQPVVVVNSNGVPVAINSTLYQSAVQVTHTGDTAEFTHLAFTLPANTLGPNGSVLVEGAMTCPSNANTKTARLKFGGTNVLIDAVTTTNFIRFSYRIINRNATNSQVTLPNNLTNSFGNTSAVVQTLAIDTTQDVTIAITGQLGVGTDNINLEWAVIQAFPGD